MRPGYKQTAVGLIPEGWEVDSIGNVFRLINGRAFKPDDWKSQGTPIIRIQNLNDPNMPFNYSTAPVEDRHRIEAGDLLFAWSGTTGTSFGARVWKGPSGVLNQHIFKVITDERKQDPAFSLLTFQRIQEDIEKQAHGFKASFVHVKKSDLVKVCLSLPPIPEQRAIVEVLSDVDALLGALDRLIAKKRDLKQAMMQQLLTGQKRLPGFHGEWEVKTLGELASVSKGTQLHSSEANLSGKFAHLNGGITASGYTDKSNTPGSTIAISEGGNSCGYVQFMEESYWCGGHCYSICPNSIENRFLYHALKGRQSSIMGLRVGSGLPNVQKTALLSFKLRYPPIPSEQTAIAKVLSDMDTEIAALEKRREKTRALKQGMMQELLTGRIRLVSEASNIVAFPQAEPAAAKTTKSHNWQINEAVVISVLAKHFGSEQWPLGRKRYTKFSYLLHRHEERQAEGYLKKAAGPYNPETKYKGPEAIAVKNGYIRKHVGKNASGFVAADQIAKAENYFSQWYGDDALRWLEQFRYKKNDELELLATVDMAMEDLRRAGQTVDLGRVKKIIQDSPEWTPKLQRDIFSDANITRAIDICLNMFA